MPKLGVNIDHVATVREARKIDYPDPVKAALLAQAGGADSIVCHLREDRRHIQDMDLYRLKKAVSVKLNLEMAMSKEIIDIALDVRPEQITLVPERRKELTTEGGLDVISQKNRIKKLLKKMEARGIGVSIFVDPNKREIHAIHQTGVRMIELHTGSYANAKNKKAQDKEYCILEESAQYAKNLGLKVFAGHGLNYKNIRRLIGIEEIEEYNIGHSIIAYSIFVGLKRAVRDMKACLK